MRLSARTIEDWYYRWRKHGLDGLETATRSDAGTTSVTPEVRDLLIRAKREKPRRSIPRLIKILERAKVVPKGSDFCAPSRWSTQRGTDHHACRP